MKFKVAVEYMLVREYDIEVNAEDGCGAAEDVAREKALEMVVEGTTIVPGDIQEENVYDCEEM